MHRIQVWFDRMHINYVRGIICVLSVVFITNYRHTFQSLFSKHIPARLEEVREIAIEKYLDCILHNYGSSYA